MMVRVKSPIRVAKVKQKVARLRNLDEHFSKEFNTLNSRASVLYHRANTYPLNSGKLTSGDTKMVRTDNTHKRYLNLVVNCRAAAFKKCAG